jgi:hypothetical protein
MHLTLSECNPFTYAGQNSSSLFAFSEDWNGIPDVAVKLVIIAFCLSDWVDVWDTFCLNVTKTLIPNPTWPGQDMVPMAFPRFQRLRRRNSSRLWRRCHLLPQIFIAVFKFLFAMVVVLPINLTGGKDKTDSKRLLSTTFSSRRTKQF